MTGEKLATILEAYHADKWGYVLGANGEYYTPELADKWERTRGKSPGYFTRDCAHWYNHYVADCSGSIVSAMRSEQSKYTDRTANGFKSQFVQSGAISTIPEIRGLAVWKDGHIGIYVGNRNVIEFRGYKYGCVLTNLDTDKRGWTLWGKIQSVEYGTLSYPRTMQIATKGGTLNLRRLGSETSDVIIEMPNGALFAAHHEENSWVYGAWLDTAKSRYRWGYASLRYLK